MVRAFARVLVRVVEQDVWVMCGEVRLAYILRTDVTLPQGVNRKWGS